MLGSVRDQERPLGKMQPHWHLKAQDWSGHGEKLRLSAIKRAYERLLMKVQSSCSRRHQYFGDASTIKWPPRIGSSVEWSKLEPRMIHRAELERSDLWQIAEDHLWIPIGYLLNKAANREYNQFKKKKCCIVFKAEMRIDTGNVDTESLSILILVLVSSNTSFPCYFVMLLSILWCWEFVIYNLTLIL